MFFYLTDSVPALKAGKLGRKKGETAIQQSLPLSTWLVVLVAQAEARQTLWPTCRLQSNICRIFLKGVSYFVMSFSWHFRILRQLDGERLFRRSLRQQLRYDHQPLVAGVVLVIFLAAGGKSQGGILLGEGHAVEGLTVVRNYKSCGGAENGVTVKVTPFFCVQG
jgi:hypothetical protein